MSCNLTRAIIEEHDDIYELLRANNIYPVTTLLDPCILAFVYYSRKGRYYIIVNSLLSPRAQRQVFIHEFHHITKHLPGINYIVGFDMMRHTYEFEADYYSRKIMTLMKKRGRRF